MLLENQTIQMKWSGRNKKWYESKGYEYTHIGDFFDIKAIDLSPSSKEKVSVQCDYCGDIYEVTWGAYNKQHQILHKDACTHCSGKKASEVHRTERIERNYQKALETCRLYNYQLISPKDCFDNVKNYIQYKCPRHGIKNVILDSFIRGFQCKQCSAIDASRKVAHTPDEVEREINAINNNILLNKNEYVSLEINNLKIKCGICGNIFYRSLASYRKGSTCCDHCSKRMSHGERKIADFLNTNNIPFESEKQFKGCKDKKELRFDFYLPTLNMCIEFDGENHYQESFYRNRVEDLNYALKETQRRDEIKNEYCKKHDIELLRIPYWERSNIDEILNDKLIMNFA